MLQTRELRVFEVKDYSVVSNRGLRPTATMLVRFRDREIHATGTGDGGYDAFMQALKSIEKQLGFGCRNCSTTRCESRRAARPTPWSRPLSSGKAA